MPLTADAGQAWWADHPVQWEETRWVPQGALAELQVAAGVIRIVLIIGQLGPAASAFFTAAEMGWKFFSCFRLSYDFSIGSALGTGAARVIGKAH